MSFFSPLSTNPRNVIKARHLLIIFAQSESINVLFDASIVLEYGGLILMCASYFPSCVLYISKCIKISQHDGE